MTKKIYWATLFLCLLSTGLLQSQNGFVEIKIQNISYKKGGSVKVCLYNCEEYFNQRSSQIALLKSFYPTSSHHSLMLANLPVGQYAVMAFQDLNNNRILDYNTIHFPSEPYGFSRNSGWFLPPLFKQTFFEIFSNDTSVVKVKMKKGFH